MPVIGTAGHVDHGKSTLIQRITGRNPDRWAEEQERGLTIDLGFAWTTLPNGSEVSFVDVPGHERFLKNMLAGIEAIDVALFVVAADEGWMPQSEEHLAVLDLLDVRRGVVAVSKSDLVDDDLLDLAMAEVEESLRGTSLEGVKVMPVSGATGQGVDDLLAALGSQLPESPPDRGRPRLWVDRSFAVTGAGTVVTGTLLDGSLSVDETVRAYPSGPNMRIRGIQSHEKTHDSIEPGRRVALNLGGVGHDEIGRGEMVGRPDQWLPTDRFTVSVRTARFVDELDRRGAYQLHIGSAAHRVDIVGLDSGYAVLNTATALPLTVGDRYILRDTGRKLVVAGGQVVDPGPPRTRRALSAAATIDPSAAPDEIANRLLQIRNRDEIATLATHSGGGIPSVGIVIGDMAISVETFDFLTARAADLVAEEHVTHPLRPGIPLATLAERLDVPTQVAETVVDESSSLVRRGPDVALIDHQPQLTEDQVAAWRRARGQLAEGLAVPLESELGLDPEIVALKVRSKELVRVAPDLVYLPDQLEEIRRILDALEGEFTVADFRDAAGLTRKYAVPVLEWSDKEGLTVRRGDVRRIR